MSGNPVRHSNVRKTLARRLIVRSARSIEAYRYEHGNVGYIGGGSNPGLQAAVVRLGEDAELIADRMHALLSPTCSILVPSDPLLTFVAEALVEEAHIQGFTYAGHCVILILRRGRRSGASPGQTMLRRRGWRDGSRSSG